MPPQNSAKLSGKAVEKDYWHLYSLQALPPSRFIGVVQKVPVGRYSLISSRAGRTVAS
jgi:hypothetical protein